MTLTSVIILMTVCAWALLLAVAAVQACLLALVAREWHKLEGVKEHARKSADVAADLTVLKKSVNLLEEVVDTKLNRLATTSSRGRKKKQEEDKPELPSDLFFPSMVGSDRETN